MRSLLWLVPAVLAAQQVRITETAGIARVNEPVTVEIDGQPRTLYITAGANQTRTVPLESLAPGDTIRMHRKPGETGFLVENAVFAADLTPREVRGQIEDSGVLRGLLYKAAGVTLRRTQNRMHWAPSFQRPGARGYTSIATWTPVQLHDLQISPGAVRFTREGFHRDYPEIRLWAEYRFFAHVPYFLFESKMDIVQPVEIYWLRNQEMTMDDLFTHVAWPQSGGAARIAAFEERKPLLEKDPLPLELPWVAFYHQERGYGYGAVVLHLTATTTANAKTAINDGADNGKYWDRHLIGQVNTALKPGDRYTEKTAYVLFRTRPGAPIAEFLEWEKRLRNPVRIEILH
jgi:hypothetical protein